MTYDVVVLRRAESDLRDIVRWIADRSVTGASSWLNAYEALMDRLAYSADTCAAAIEDQDCHIPLKQELFGTRHGSTYRAVFTIVGNQVRILRFRGPGQPPLRDDELL